MEERKTAAAETTTDVLTDDAKVLRNSESAKESKVNPQSTNKISMLSQELEEKSKLLDEQATVGSKSDGIFIVKSANQAMQDAKDIPDPKPLWLSLWNEGEVCCLFADSGVGKSIYAVQIATAIAQNQNVLYFDFELTEKQFQLRYTNEKGENYKWPAKLFRVEANPEKMNIDNFEKEVIDGIEALAQEYNTKVLIIDNLSWLCNAAEDGELAAKLMKELMKFKKKHGWSILVLAHTPKRDMNRPITQNDISGSKKIPNFIDSAFSIGFSVLGESNRYIKEIKTRLGKTTYGANNVINAVIEKPDNFLQFKTIGYGSESEHLQQSKRQNKDYRETDNSKSDKLRTAFANIFKNHNEGVGRNELARLLAVEYGYKIDKESKCKSGQHRIDDGIEEGIICKHDDGKYYLK